MVKLKPKSSVDNRQDFDSNKLNDVIGETNEKNKQHATLEVVVNNSEKLEAEIIWTLKTLSSVYLNNSSKDISDLLYAMFPDSKIAKDMGLGADKVKYVINFGIGPVFKNALTERIKKSKYYVFSFFFLNSHFLGHSTHTDLLRIQQGFERSL